MLSDGAGAVVVQDRPASEGLSYRIEWVTLMSYAHTTDPCIPGSNGQNGMTYQDYSDVAEAALDGAMSLRQNMRLLPRLIRTCARDAKVGRRGPLRPGPDQARGFHYSSEALRDTFRRAFQREGIEMMEDRWFSNLTRVETSAARRST